jgi:hypothetical protein
MHLIVLCSYRITLMHRHGLFKNGWSHLGQRRVVNLSVTGKPVAGRTLQPPAFRRAVHRSSEHAAPPTAVGVLLIHITTTENEKIQGNQKVSVHLMITVQNITSNVQSVPASLQAFGKPGGH